MLISRSIVYSKKSISQNKYISLLRICSHVRMSLAVASSWEADFRNVQQWLEILRIRNLFQCCQKNCRFLLMQGLMQTKF